MSNLERILCTLALAASGLPAQTTAPPPLMHLYPVALDSSGQPVTDLTAGDFTITDQAKPQTIFFFRGPGGAATAALGPHEYSNRPGGGMPHSIAILFDLMNEVDADRLDTWHTLAKSIPQLESGENIYFYVMSLDGDLVPIHAMGSKGGDDAKWPQDFEKPFNKTMKSLAGRARSAQIGKEDQVKKTYHQLEVLGNELATLPGRRDIIWITNGMPNVWNPTPKIPCNGDWVECGLYVAHMGVTLEHDGVAVNPYSFSGNLAPNVNYDLEQMALLTGGRGYFRQDIRDVLKQVARDNSGTYEIAYDPSPENWDNKFHKIRIDCARKGVKLQVKQRYYALPDSRPAADRQKAILVAAYQSPSDSADIGLRVKTAPAADNKGLHLEIRIHTADLMLNQKLDKFEGALTFLLSDRGASGPLGDPNVQTFNLDLTKEQRDMVAKEGIPISQDHPITGAVEHIRLIVQDQNTNEIGSLTFPVK